MKFKIRVSDNVLEEKDWPVHELTIDGNSVVTAQTTILEGVYSIEDFVGKTMDDVLKWTHHDDTGTHPEMLHEIFVPAKGDGKWVSFVKEIPVGPDGHEETAVKLLNILCGQMYASSRFFLERGRVSEQDHIQDMATINSQAMCRFYDNPTKNGLKTVMAGKAMTVLGGLLSKNNWKAEPADITMATMVLQGIIEDALYWEEDLRSEGLDHLLDMIEKNSKTEKVVPDAVPEFPSELIGCDGECGFIRAGFGWHCRELEGCGRQVNPGDKGYKELTEYYNYNK